MNYLDITSVLTGMVRHPYPIFPIAQINLSINTSLISVFFMLIYQFSEKRGVESVFIFGLLASACTGLCLGSVTEDLGILQFQKGMGIWILIVINYVEFLLAYGLTTFFLKFKDRDEEN